jgi:hypothetical protein
VNRGSVIFALTSILAKGLEFSAESDLTEIDQLFVAAGA